MLNWRGPVAGLWRSIRTVFLVVGAVTCLVCASLIGGFSLGFDSWLDVTSSPSPADAIICIAGGTSNHDIPTGSGWQRIHTSVQLFTDGYAPVVVFTGRGNSKVSEAEIYADAGRWLGLPDAAIGLDPLPASTAEHPEALLKSMAGRITRSSRLLLVTSNLHSRRVLMTFRKRGFTNVIVVSEYAAKNVLPNATRRQQSNLPAFTRDNKQYGDPLFKLARGSSVLFTVLREWAALAVYKARGQV